MSSKLTNKQYISYSELTRYSSFPIYFNADDEKYIMSTTANLVTDTNYSLYTVKMGDTLDTLAYKFYLNPTYYWAIADFNRIGDPFAELKAGTQLKIPVLSDMSYIDLGVS